jgi:hypothetical protein
MLQIQVLNLWHHWLDSQRCLKTSHNIISNAIELLPQWQYWILEYSTVPCCTAVYCAISSSHWWHFVTGRRNSDIDRTVMEYSSSLRQQSTTTYSTNSQLGHTVHLLQLHSEPFVSSHHYHCYYYNYLYYFFHFYHCYSHSVVTISERYPHSVWLSCEWLHGDVAYIRRGFNVSASV